MKAILAGAMVALAMVLSGCDEDIDKSLANCNSHIFVRKRNSTRVCAPRAMSLR
jgi:hypothetical protein